MGDFFILRNMFFQNISGLNYFYRLLQLQMPPRYSLRRLQPRNDSIKNDNDNSNSDCCEGEEEEVGAVEEEEEEVEAGDSGYYEEEDEDIAGQCSQRSGATRRLLLRCCTTICTKLCMLSLAVVLLLMQLIRSLVPSNFGDSDQGQRFINGVLNLIHREDYEEQNFKQKNF